MSYPYLSAQNAAVFKRVFTGQKICALYFKICLTYFELCQTYFFLAPTWVKTAENQFSHYNGQFPGITMPARHKSRPARRRVGI